ncbi:aspartic proteinase nepenthesin-1-like [Quillaja saponaria]|uniref:Aspartic proteinase nepenthesin-1-like n=1 Tax=Quillaja saponaria TaxID=32244 RepID=A0AAD7QHZ6_QUISA|nr:aspartic proteinase nepenthesin-1-like [Quillaja saponaria]
MSPFYAGNLTFLETLKQDVKLSDARVTHLVSTTKHSKSTTTPQPNLMHPSVLGDSGGLYSVSIAIGTPPKDFHLLLDTAADLIWTQCEPCVFCYPKTSPIYDSRASSTYKNVPCDHVACDKNQYQCGQNDCTYILTYGGGAEAKGIISWETFTFNTQDEPSTTFGNMLFGCSNDNSKFPLVLKEKFDGVLGLSKGLASLVVQLGSFADYRFSYCLVKPQVRPMSYMKFGTDMGFRGGAVKTTKFVKINANPEWYGLSLVDISVNGKRLNFPPNTFAERPDGGGGTIIDSGAQVSLFEKGPYTTIENAFIDYFLQYDMERDNVCSDKSLLCYKLPKDFNSFPSMTYHFQDADFTVAPENVFLVNREDSYFALPIVGSDGLNLLGAAHQENTRIVYDLNIDSLWFVPEDCSQDGY